MDNKDLSLTLRDWPILFWIIGAALLLEGVTFFLPLAEGQTAYLVRAVLGLAGLAIFLTASVLTVTADRVTQTLTISHHSPLRAKQRELLFSQIDSIDLDYSRGSRGGTTYRIVVTLKDGETIPFHSYYNSGSGRMKKKVNRLRSFLGMEPLDFSFTGMFRRATQEAKAQFQQQQEAMTGSEAEVHETDGVRWQVQTVAYGGQPVTRWFSTDTCLPDGFVYITQIAEGQKMSSEGLLGGLTGMLYKQSLNVYGFGSEDTPGIETAELMDSIDPELVRAFSVYTNVPARAQQILNSRTVAALADWARRYPLKTINIGTHVFSQLAVMFSPKGVYVCSLGTMIPEAVEEMTRLGTELVKSQGTTVSS
jgi:hypothetical protein